MPNPGFNSEIFLRNNSDHIEQRTVFFAKRLSEFLEHFLPGAEAELMMRLLVMKKQFLLNIGEKITYYDIIVNKSAEIISCLQNYMNCKKIMQHTF